MSWYAIEDVVKLPIALFVVKWQNTKDYPGAYHPMLYMAIGKVIPAPLPGVGIVPITLR